MNKIDEKFAEMKRKNEKALIAYFTAGFPSVKKTTEIVRKAEKAGVDIIELGVPFSDPIADGPIIQYASFKSIERGINIDKIFGICEVLKKSVNLPYLLMTYYNPVYKYGCEKFAKRCSETGVSGIIIPDLPFEESGNTRTTLKRFDVTLVSFITPFTPVKRAEKILKNAEGFVYFITSAGVTGPRKNFSNEMVKSLKAIRAMTHIPVAAGFGITSKDQIEQVKNNVDGVIIGSFFVKKIIDGKIEELWTEIRGLKKPLKGKRSYSG
jgi:tryptophan synthase alpha chain